MVEQVPLVACIRSMASYLTIKTMMLSNNINHFEKAFKEAQQEENRKGGRFLTTSVSSTLGEVIDLSHRGALILKKRFKSVPKMEQFAMRIRYEEIDVAVSAKVVRRFKKKGIGHLLAVEFVEIDEDKRSMVMEIVRNSRNWRLFDFSETEAA